jgi:hypothetical protein
MKAYISLIFVIITISHNLYSQKFKKPISYRFKYGETGFVSFFTKNIAYPELAIKNGTVGHSIIRVSVDSTGTINGINIINPIDSIIDNEVLRVIYLSRKQWKSCDTIKKDQVFYIQIAFSLPGFLPNLCVPKSKEILKYFPEPIVITPPKLLKSDISKENDSIQFFYVKNEELSEKVNSFMDKGKYEEALPIINELIKRDPFNRDLYKVRIMINIRLERPELVEQDDNKIFDFAEGYSIDELIKAQQ